MVAQPLGARSAHHARVRWDPEVEAYFNACFGASRLASMSAALARPSLTPALRVNTLRARPEDVVRTLEELERAAAAAEAVAVEAAAAAAAPGAGGENASARWRRPPPRLHPHVPGAVVLSGRGPCRVEYEPSMSEVVINRFAAEAVLKGANVYAPGLLAASPGIAAGQRVAVSAALERPVGQQPSPPPSLTLTTAPPPPAELLGAPAEEEAEAQGGGGSGRRPRLAVGISRGAAVGPDGSVPLAWARQAPTKRRRRQQRPPLRQQQEGGGAQLELAQGASTQGGLTGIGLKPTGDGDDQGANRSGGGSSCCGSDSSSSGGGDSDGTDSDATDSDAGSRDAGSAGGGSSCCGDGWRQPRAGRGDGGRTDSGGVGGVDGGGGVGADGSGGGVSSRADRLYLGVGVAAAGRRQLFRSGEGLAVAMERRLYDVPPCNGLLPGQVMLQALPSQLAAQVLSPRPGAAVLDMCAAPGGKSTALAALTGNAGRVIALDRTAAKVQEILSLARDLGASCVEAYKADATAAVLAPGPAGACEGRGGEAGRSTDGDVADGSALRAAALPPCGAPVAPHGDGGEGRDGAAAGGSTEWRRQTAAAGTDMGAAAAAAAAGAQAAPPPGPPPYPPGCLPYILLDPPCSALGLRPRLLHEWSLGHLDAMAAYQRSLLHTAFSLLAPGGQMVYCTCSVNPGENEGNVAWALDRWAGRLELLPAEPLLGLRGLTGSDPRTGARWLTEREAEMVQRFDPGVLLPGRRQRLEAAAAADAVLGLAEAETGRQRPGGGQGQPSDGEGQAGGQGQAAGDEGWRGEPGGSEGGDDVMGFFIARFRKVY